MLTFKFSEACSTVLTGGMFIYLTWWLKYMNMQSRSVRQYFRIWYALTFKTWLKMKSEIKRFKRNKWIKLKADLESCVWRVVLIGNSCGKTQTAKWKIYHASMWYIAIWLFLVPIYFWGIVVHFRPCFALYAIKITYSTSSRNQIWTSSIFTLYSYNSCSSCDIVNGHYYLLVKVRLINIV